jgi:hypothetical protein
MQSLEALAVYQKNLSKKLAENKQLKQGAGVDFVKENKNSKSISWLIGMGILLGGLVLVVVGYLVWRKKNNK